VEVVSRRFLLDGEYLNSPTVSFPVVTIDGTIEKVQEMAKGPIDLSLIEGNSIRPAFIVIDLTVLFQIQGDGKG